MHSTAGGTLELPLGSSITSWQSQAKALTIRKGLKRYDAQGKGAGKRLLKALEWRLFVWGQSHAQ